MTPLITILVRGGSKGLPNKHLLELHGKPLIAWTIQQAQEWGRGDILVCTDSAEIERVALDYGVKSLLHRPADLALDDTPKLDVLRYVLHRLEYYQTVIDLDATAPLRLVSDIENAYCQFLGEKKKNLVSVVECRHNPYFNQVEVNKGEVGLVKTGGVFRRQDTPLVYDMNASIYVYDRSFILDVDNRHPVTKKTGLYVMEDWQGYDIDSAVDFAIVEKMMEKYCFNARHKLTPDCNYGD